MAVTMDDKEIVSQLWNIVNNKPWLQSITTTFKNSKQVLVVKVNKIVSAKELELVPENVNGIPVKIFYQKPRY